MTDPIAATPPAPGAEDPALGRLTGPDWFERAIAEPFDDLRVPVEGAMIEARVWGPVGAPGLVMMHGSRAHLGWWSYLAPLFQDQFRVAVFSFSGMGRSDWRPRYTTRLWGEECWAVAEAGGLLAGGAAPVVVSHSFGSIPLLEMAANPDRPIRFGVMVDNVMPAPETLGAVRSGPHKVYPDLATALSRFRFVPAEPCDNAWAVDYLARMALRPEAGGWTWRYDPWLWDRIDRGDAWGQLSRLVSPMAVIRGGTSILTAGDLHRRMVAAMPQGTPVVTIPEAGHHVGADQPIALVTALRMLLAPYG